MQRSDSTASSQACNVKSKHDKRVRKAQSDLKMTQTDEEDEDTLQN